MRYSFFVDESDDLYIHFYGLFVKIIVINTNPHWSIIIFYEQNRSSQRWGARPHKAFFPITLEVESLALSIIWVLTDMVPYKVVQFPVPNL